MPGPWFDELAELLRIPSVSADPAHAGDVERAAEWLAEFVRSGGGAAEVVKTDTHPLIVGELPASNGAAAPTVLVYGHVDVQPPEPLELWESEPFAPEVRGEWLYGRGVADDKGQLYMLVKAATELARADELPVNVRIACDSEEESGGHQIVDFLAADERGADAAVIFDAGMTTRGVPELYLATRGLVYLTQILSAVLPRDGRLPEPLRAGIAPPTDEEVAACAQLVPGPELLAGAGARPADPHAAEEFHLRTTAEPALDVNGIVGGSPLLQKTVLPVVAEANVSVRLAPGQDVEVIAGEVERLLREGAPKGAELELARLSAAPAGLVSPDADAVQLALEAFERVMGRRPLLVRSGGTLPIIPALADKGIPTILSGFALLPESNIHSPNERILVEYVPLGIETSRELYKSLAALQS